MTAVAPPLTFQPTSRIGWSSASANGNGFSTMDDQRMFAPSGGVRKPPTRSNSSSSLASTASSTSTISAVSSGAQSNGSSVTSNEAGSWAARKKAGGRALWPPGKAEPATGLSTARPQAVSSASSGPTASSAISALHAPMLPSQQMANANGTQANGTGILQRGQQGGQVQNEPPQAVLHLLPMNGTFERKTITVPYYPDVLRIGRQTNAKTVPTPHNGFFDSKVLSRQHAEIYAEATNLRQANGYAGSAAGARIFIRDVKSSNGTFVNGVRLSQENKESEPRELREQDVLELGIDIVSEDQKTVVHHKVAAKVEHAGVYGQNGQGQGSLDFGDLDPSGGGGLMGGAHQPLKRTGSQGSLNSVSSRPPLNNTAAMNGGLGIGHGQHMRNWLNPITTEHIVKKLNSEMKLAMQQSQDLARARQAIESMLNNTSPSPVTKESRSSFEKARPSPTKSKSDLKSMSISFSEPPAPPPQAPLPEKPDVARALADPIIQPLLRRSDTARPPFENASPTRADHSSDILRLCEELKLAKGEISSHEEKMKNLEDQLQHERSARESAEERAKSLEMSEERQDSPRNADGGELLDEIRSDEEDVSGTQIARIPASDLQEQLENLRASMDEMKQQMESYRQRAESAENERDEARQSLAELVEQKRKDNATPQTASTPSKTIKAPKKNTPKANGASTEANGQAVAPKSESPTSVTLLERAGVREGEVITQEQAKIMTQLLTQEILKPDRRSGEGSLGYYGTPAASATAVFVVGVLIMGYLNGWNKIER